MKYIEKLYERLFKLEDTDFYEMESEFCAELQYIPKERKPSVVTASLMIANWFAMSLRSGAWTFYEVWNPKDINICSIILAEDTQ